MERLRIGTESRCGQNQLVGDCCLLDETGTKQWQTRVIDLAKRGFKNQVIEPRDLIVARERGQVMRLE